MKLFLSLLIIIISFLMVFLHHPLSMGLMILMQTLLVCLMSGMIISTYWFSYILFLTFLGGLLIMFIYISSIASNEMFKINLNMLITFFLLLIMIINITMLLNNNLTWLNLSNNNDMSNFFNLFLFFNNENKINLSKLYNNQTFLLMMIMMIYLLITLIAIVKIINIFYGPLRSSIN
uniref:NADH-ubiquinone oxidoreductase chain 6 n=1 Tax=Chilo suppressalis TaxID=168631 RepID=G0Z2A0_CHISP|nr:NADH dehydrogenase subunit 6 [Chilo suppressalis]QAX27892.1 NADH dehydrogenase subunit 6 [Chilo suppressalis]